MDNARAFAVLTLLVAVCEQALEELDATDETQSIRALVEATHDVAVSVAHELSRPASPAEHPA